MSLSSSLTPRAVEAPDCPSRPVVPTRVTEVLCVSHEAARFGTCERVIVSVPIVSVDNGEEAAIAALTAFQTGT
jgi:hypothetical protein